MRTIIEDLTYLGAYRSGQHNPITTDEPQGYIIDHVLIYIHMSVCVCVCVCIR